MKTVRNLVLALLAVCGLSCTLAASSEAQAGTPVRAQLVSHRAYYIYYRTCPRSSWVYYGYTYSSSDAYAYVNYIRGYGYEAFAR